MTKRAANKLRMQLKSFYKKRNLPFSKAEYRKAKRIYTSLPHTLKASLLIK